jgi:hypothetical protein
MSEGEKPLTGFALTLKQLTDAHAAKGRPVAVPGWLARADKQHIIGWCRVNGVDPGPWLAMRDAAQEEAKQEEAASAVPRYNLETSMRMRGERRRRRTARRWRSCGLNGIACVKHPLC